MPLHFPISWHFTCGAGGLVDLEDANEAEKAPPHGSFRTRRESARTHRFVTVREPIPSPVVSEPPVKRVAAFFLSLSV
jgi:hypothetical protein